MVQNYEDNIIQPITKQVPPLRDIVNNMIQDHNLTPKPKTEKTVPTLREIVNKMIQDIIIQTPKPRTKIEEKAQALKGSTKSYEISIQNKKDPLEQLKNTRKALETHIKNILIDMKGLKFIEVLKVTFTKMSGNEIIDKFAYFNGQAQTIIRQHRNL